MNYQGQEHKSKNGRAMTHPWRLGGSFDRRSLLLLLLLLGLRECLLLLLLLLHVALLLFPPLLLLLLALLRFALLLEPQLLGRLGLPLALLRQLLCLLLLLGSLQRWLYYVTINSMLTSGGISGIVHKG